MQFDNSAEKRCQKSQKIWPAAEIDKEILKNREIKKNFHMKVFLWAARIQQFWQPVEKLSEKVSKNAQFPEPVKTTFFQQNSRNFSQDS